MPNILFVCSGNRFRSLSADLALKSVLPPGSAIRVSSAGTIALPTDPVHEDVIDRLKAWDADCSTHTPRRLTREILEAADLVVAMGTDHQEFIEHNFGKRVPLYLEIACGRAEGLPDNWEVIPDYEDKPDENRAYLHQTVDLIFGYRERFLENVKNWLPRPAGPSAPSPAPVPR